MFSFERKIVFFGSSAKILIYVRLLPYGLLFFYYFILLILKVFASFGITTCRKRNRNVSLAEKIHSLCKTRSYQWALKKAAKLNEAAKNNPFEYIVYQSHLVSLKMFIKMLLQYQEHLSILDEQIDTLAKDIEEYEIIQSIPGIGEKIAATIISEIGEIDRFNHPKKLVAYAGIDPSVHQSGKFTATINRITKRGSSRLRHVLYMAVLCGIRSSRNKRLKEFYDRKREEGKPSKVAIIACVNKLLHWIYILM